MTSNNTLKKIAREHAAKTGVSYTQARREILALHQNMQVRIKTGATTPEMARWVQIQQAVRGDSSTPLPFTFDPYGFVGNQDFWRGDPWRLIGFIANPDGDKVVDLQREEFLADPERAIGMHQVLMGRDRSWATWKGSVAQVEVREKPVVDPDLAYAEFSLRTPAGKWTTTIGVAHLLHCLSRVDIAMMRATGGDQGSASEDLLSLLCMTGHDRALELSSYMDDVEDEDLLLEAHLVIEDEQAWTAAGGGRR